MRKIWQRLKAAWTKMNAWLGGRAALSVLKKVWAFLKWFGAGVADGTFGIVKRPVELLACATFMVCALGVGLWLGAAWAKHVGMKSHMIVGAADGIDLPAAFARCKSIANAKHELVLDLEKELAAIRAATRVSEDKVVETCKPKVVYVKAKRAKTFIEDVFGE